MNDIDACDPSEFLERFTEGQKTYKAMPLREFAETVNAMNILYTVGRDHSRMKSIKGKTVEEVIDAIMTDASALRPASPVEATVSCWRRCRSSARCSQNSSKRGRCSS